MSDIIHEPITRELLNRYTKSCRELALCEERKRKLTKKIGLSAVDYSKIKVTSGNGHRPSEQERYVQILERINREIECLKSEIKPIHDNIVLQVRRLESPKSRTIITLKYIEGRSTQDLVEYYFCDDPLWNPEGNITEFKKSPEYENYRRQYLLWQEKAINDLEAITGVAFMPNANYTYKQLYLEGI